MQGYAATAAWDEVYDRLACGWIAKTDNPAEKEPYLILTLIREFFEDSATVFNKAESGALPVHKI